MKTRIGDPTSTAPSLVWARVATRWPYATASVLGLVLWFATDAVLANLAPSIPHELRWVGLLIGVTIGSAVAGLDGARGWVAVPVITMALACLLGGVLGLFGLPL